MSPSNISSHPGGYKKVSHQIEHVKFERTLNISSRIENSTLQAVVEVSPLISANLDGGEVTKLVWRVFIKHKMSGLFKFQTFFKPSSFPHTGV